MSLPFRLVLRLDYIFCFIPRALQHFKVVLKSYFRSFHSRFNCRIIYFRHQSNTFVKVLIVIPDHSRVSMLSKDLGHILPGSPPLCGEFSMKTTEINIFLKLYFTRIASLLTIHKKVPIKTVS